MIKNDFAFILFFPFLHIFVVGVHIGQGARFVVLRSSIVFFLAFLAAFAASLNLNKIGFKLT